jgi:hypothetical protein
MMSPCPTKSPHCERGNESKSSVLTRGLWRRLGAHRIEAFL